MIHGSMVHHCYSWLVSLAASSAVAVVEPSPRCHIHLAQQHTAGHHPLFLSLQNATAATHPSSPPFVVSPPSFLPVPVFPKPKPHFHERVSIPREGKVKDIEEFHLRLVDVFEVNIASAVEEGISEKIREGIEKLHNFLQSLPKQISLDKIAAE